MTLFGVNIFPKYIDHQIRIFKTALTG